MTVHFTVKDQPVVVNLTAAPQKNKTDIAYKNDSSIQTKLVEIVPNDPTPRPVDLKARQKDSLNTRWQTEGTIETPLLAPGEDYKLCDAEGLKADSVCILVHAVAGQTKLLADGFKVQFGGTWVEIIAPSSAPVVLVVEIGPASSGTFTDSAGFHHVKKEVVSFGPIAGPFAPVDYKINNSKVFTGQDFHPGKDYNWVVRVMDMVGGWEERTGRLTLLRRTVTVKPDVIFVEHCNAFVAHGWFTYGVGRDPHPPGKVGEEGDTRSFTDGFGFDLRAEDPLWHTVTLGPEEDLPVFVHVEGTEHVLVGTDNGVISGPRPLRLRFDKGAETFSDTFSVHVQDAAVYGFVFFLRGTYDVKYS